MFLNQAISFLDFAYFKGKVIIASEDGLGFKVSTDNLIASTKSGKKVLSLNEGKKAKALSICHGNVRHV